MRVGLIFDDIYLLHDTGWHVENPKRLSQTLQILEKKGFLGKLARIVPRAASMEEITLVHQRDYVKRLEAFCKAGGGYLDPDTVASPKSFEVALFAAGGVIAGVDAIQAGKMLRAFALVRPPGHHALPDRAMGFCLFNNVAVAARYAVQHCGYKRVLIVDWDYHHGNGTEVVFYEDPEVLYFSTHSALGYPGTGWPQRVGEGRGKGFNINVALPNTTGDADMRFVFQEILVPVAEEYRPDLILVSAGQDGYRGDPIAGMRLTAAGYGVMAQIVREIADRYAGGRLMGVLEGGYDLEGLGASICAILEAWITGKTAPAHLPEAEVRPEVAAAVAEVKENQRGYWRCFRDRSVVV